MDDDARKDTQRDVSNYDRWRQLYEKVQGQQAQIDEIKDRLPPKINRDLPSTEHEKMQVELKQWEKYYPFDSDPYTISAYRNGHEWNLLGRTFKIKDERNCRTILACIQAAEIERAIKAGRGVIRNSSGWTIKGAAGEGEWILTYNQLSLLAALLELRKREERKDNA